METTNMHNHNNMKIQLRIRFCILQVAGKCIFHCQLRQLKKEKCLSNEKNLIQAIKIMVQHYGHSQPDFFANTLISRPIAFFLGSLVLPKEDYSCNVLLGQRCRPTKHEKPHLLVIRLTGRSVAYVCYHSSSFLEQL